VAGEEPQSVAGDGQPGASAAGGEQPLVCPGCAREHPPSERFCTACGMPLVHSGDAEAVLSERRQRARKIKPQYAEGPLVKVAHAASQGEGDLITGLLLEEGIPSMLRHALGFDLPDAAVGSRDVLVPESGAQAAEEALAWEEPEKPV
jgi:hypothetical protein